ncbi:14311_t:CDS:2 [Cetraspora pellucida]|uniref:14311_t:CDS:1 n=1 Tax=Cetraspora pellucida TaxID=1433469 RepID=A0ACA9KP81_9GLOM|nr:14311_t:CDS:2 [Cetraspora pellucida]
MLEYLTPHILSVECIEIAQCLYFNAIIADPEIIDLENENNENINDKFIEDVYDARQILLKSMVMKANRDNIQEIWEIMDKRPRNNQRKHFIIIMNSVSYLCTCMSNVSHGVICHHYFQIMLTSQIARFHIGMIAQCWYCDNKKGEIDQLDVIFAAQCQQNQITQIVPKPLIMPHSLVVETDDDEMKQWLKAFIDQKKCSATNNNNEMSIDKENDLKITNLPVTKHKGRPETKQYKSAVKKAHRQLYACCACSQVKYIGNKNCYPN